MARAKKEPRKWTPEERAIDVWNQQVFFLKKNFPDAERNIQMIQKQFMPKKKDEPFIPTEDAIEVLRELYKELKVQESPSPRPMASA